MCGRPLHQPQAGLLAQSHARQGQPHGFAAGQTLPTFSQTAALPLRQGGTEARLLQSPRNIRGCTPSRPSATLRCTLPAKIWLAAPSMPCGRAMQANGLQQPAVHRTAADRQRLAANLPAGPAAPTCPHRWVPSATCSPAWMCISSGAKRLAHRPRFPAVAPARPWHRALAHRAHSAHRLRVWPTLRAKGVRSLPKACKPCMAAWPAARSCHTVDNSRSGSNGGQHQHPQGLAKLSGLPQAPKGKSPSRWKPIYMATMAHAQSQKLQHRRRKKRDGAAHARRVCAATSMGAQRARVRGTACSAHAGNPGPAAGPAKRAFIWPQLHHLRFAGSLGPPARQSP